MEKVKVTREVARAIKLAVADYGSDRVMDGVKGQWAIDKLTPLNKLYPCELARALYIGYEVEPEFKKGDFVVWHGDVVEIKHPQTNDHKDDGCCYFTLERSDGSTYGNITRDEIRLATPSEIAEEKERRFFAGHGREPWELKNNDILNDRQENRTVTIAKVIDKFPAEEITVLFTNGDWESYNNIVEDSDWRVACFADKRLDVKTNESQ